MWTPTSVPVFSSSMTMRMVIPQPLGLLSSWTLKNQEPIRKKNCPYRETPSTLFRRYRMLTPNPCTLTPSKSLERLIKVWLATPPSNSLLQPIPSTKPPSSSNHVPSQLINHLNPLSRLISLLLPPLKIDRRRDRSPSLWDKLVKCKIQ